MIPDSTGSEISPVKFVQGDSCPECAEELQWDEGDVVYCENCGMEFDVDWSRLLEEIPQDDLT